MGKQGLELKEKDNALNELVAEPKNKALVMRAIHTAVTESFKSGLLYLPRNERIERERVKWCLNTIKAIRSDLHWPWVRIAGKLPVLLKAHINGEDWEKLLGENVRLTAMSAA